MGNILDLMQPRNALEHSHPNETHHGGITDDQFEAFYEKGITDVRSQLWSTISRRAMSELMRRKRVYGKGISNSQCQLFCILIFRTISECICYKAIYEKGITDVPFQLWSILFCRAMSEHLCRKLNYEKGISDRHFRLCSFLICGVMSDYINCKPSYKFRLGNNDPFEYLPEDVLCIILSKLPLKELVRASAVSRKWRCLWTVCSKLNFNSFRMFGVKNSGTKLFIQKFIDSVNAILAQCHGRVVEELSIRCQFDAILVDHLNSWVSFAVMSRTKFLTLDLKRVFFRGCSDRYIFPFKLLDSRSITRLQKLQLSFVSIRPPTQFSGFPNLRELDLDLLDVSVKDLQDMLTNCRKLERLIIDGCHLCDELKVDIPLPCLTYLGVMSSEVTGIAFNAAKLKTFVYRGRPAPIDLIQSSELEIVDINSVDVTLVHTSTLLCNVLTNVKKLAFTANLMPPEVPFLVNNACKFSRLKFIELMLIYVDDLHSLSLISFLRSAPFIEKLELRIYDSCPAPAVQEPIKRLPERPFNYMKRLYISGYKGSNGQVQFLVHMVENAPALEVLTLKIVKDAVVDYEDVYQGARRYLDGKISPKCAVRVSPMCQKIFVV